MYTGPNIIKDGLVFGYDTGYGIADNDTATRFYPGKPTDNLNADPYHSTRSAGDTISLSAWGGDTGQGSFEVNTSPSGGGMMFINHNTSNPAGSGGTYTDFPSTRYTLTNGVTYTRSWWAKADDVRSASGHICSCNRDSTNTYIVGSSVSLTTEWQRYTHTFTYTGPTSNDWQFRHIIYDASKVYIANVQLEVSSVASPFVSGTRSSTASLIDLKETASIDVSNVSFDSTGQPDFDGSDDEINIGTGLGIQNASFSVEAVIKWDGGSTDTFFGYKGATDASQQSIHWRIYDTGLLRFDFYSNSINSGGGAIVAGEWAHLTVTYDYNNDTCICYKNGILLMQGSAGPYTGADSTSTGYVGSWGPNNQHFGGQIPIFRVYNKTLTATEIKQNFNAYKNRFDI